jgi:heme A synthase
VPLAALAIVCAAALVRPTPATGVRVLIAAALVAVMIQGLLGGLRVRLNELVGTDLAAVHGVFATLVLSLLMAIPVLTARGPTEPLPIEARQKLAWQTASLVFFTLVQIVFGALVRHMPDRMSARLHLFFAFVVVGFATLAIKQALADPATKRRLNWPARFLMALITLQILFGVEAWMGKFMTDVPLDAAKTPTIGQAILRTGHAHIGAWILAVGVVFALVCRRKPVEHVGPAPTASLDWQDATPRLATAGVRSPA